jgi:putative transposase
MFHFMLFRAEAIYHVYNQGNNRQKIFFTDENYRFFISKMQNFLLPHCELLAYCLMPNHFHWLIYVKNIEIEVKTDLDHLTDGSKQSIPMLPQKKQIRTINQSIGILLRSYTRAINKQEHRTGALFREETKARNGWISPYLYPSHPDYAKALQNWELYGATCIQYIHANPVRAKIVKVDVDRKYSSARAFAGLNNADICNVTLARELLFFK